MTRTSLRRLTAVVTLTCVLALAACGSGDETPPPSATPAATPADTRAATPSPTAHAVTPSPGVASEPGPEPDSYWVTNPASGARLYVKALFPDGGSGAWPAMVLIPGGTNDSTSFDSGQKSAAKLTSEGFAVVVFDPDGRGQSEGTEDRNGFVQQDGLAEVTRFAATLPGVDAERIGFGSFSYGVTMASGALARHPDLPVRYLIDWEGPADRSDTGGCGAGAVSKLEGAADCEDETYWEQREAATFIAQVRVPYQRVQTEKDHVQPDYGHTITMVNAAVEGAAPWVRLNDLTPGQTYDAASLPAMFPETVDRELMVYYARYAEEMMALD